MVETYHNKEPFISNLSGLDRNSYAPYSSLNPALNPNLKQSNFFAELVIGGILVAILAGWIASKYSLDYNPKASEIPQRNKREKENASTLESSLEKDELTKEEKDTLSTITAKKDYSTKDYKKIEEELEAEFGIYNNGKQTGKNTNKGKKEKNYEAAGYKVAFNEESEKVNKTDSENLDKESADANSEEGNAEEKNTADADSE